MHDNELLFVIPTHRLRDVGATIEDYDEHFRPGAYLACCKTNRAVQHC